MGETADALAMGDEGLGEGKIDSIETGEDFGGGGVDVDATGR